jgi:hypothetical protein
LWARLKPCTNVYSAVGCRAPWAVGDVVPVLFAQGRCHPQPRALYRSPMWCTGLIWGGGVVGTVGKTVQCSAALQCGTWASIEGWGGLAQTPTREGAAGHLMFGIWQRQITGSPPPPSVSKAGVMSVQNLSRTPSSPYNTPLVLAQPPNPLLPPPPFHFLLAGRAQPHPPPPQMQGRDHRGEHMHPHTPNAHT